MGREHLASRDIWQDYASQEGEASEHHFAAAMRKHLSPEEWHAERKPRELKGIYGIHNTGRPHGIIPDYVIRNRGTGRSIFVEVKRQNDAGNAHERACKYFAPGIIQSAREIARLPGSVLPFWWVFTDGLTTSPKYVREIRHWFRGVEGHLLLWGSFPDGVAVTRHFDQHIGPLLD